MLVRAGVVLLLLGVVGPNAAAQPAKRRVVVVKFRGPPAGLNKAATLCQLAVEQWYHYVPEESFREAARELGITRALWRPDNLRRIAQRARWDMAAVLFVKGDQLELGMFDGGTGKMVERIKVPFAQFKFTRETARALRVRLKKAVDAAVGLSSAPPRRETPVESPLARPRPVPVGTTDQGRVLGSSGRRVTLCLRSGTTRLDTLFTAGRSLLKVRQLRQGCPGDADATSGNTTAVTQQLRGDPLRPGMTAQKLKTVGLSLGLFGGLTSSVGFYEGNVGVGGGITLEYNFGPAVKVSELYLFVGLLFGATTDGTVIRQKILGEFPGATLVVASTYFAFGWDLGVLKRWYVAGPLFFDLGLALSGSVHELPSATTATTISNFGFGFAALLGLGVLLAPRWTLKLSVGYRVIGSVWRLNSRSKTFVEHGPALWPAVAYTF
ncbi:MAG: hypothetical protein ABI333_18710 [bacterium]